MNNLETLLASIGGEQDYEASVSRDRNVDDSLLVVSWAAGSASMWVFADLVAKLESKGQTLELQKYRLVA